MSGVQWVMPGAIGAAIINVQRGRQNAPGNFLCCFNKRMKRLVVQGVVAPETGCGTVHKNTLNGASVGAEGERWHSCPFQVPQVVSSLMAFLGERGNTLAVKRYGAKGQIPLLFQFVITDRSTTKIRLIC